jgi:hypothetical protein
MTLQGLSKYLDKYDSQLSSAAAKQPELLEGLPFYDWSIRHSVAKRITTFNNVIGLLQAAHFHYSIMSKCYSMNCSATNKSGLRKQLA